MAINIFASKKKPLIYASGQGAQYANNTQKTTSSFPSFDLSEPKVAGSSATIRQPITSVSTQTPTYQTTVNGKIPASGTGSQYANQTIPKPITTVETPKVQSAAEKYMANIQALGAKQQLAAKQRALDAEKTLKDRYKTANEELGLQVPELDTELQNFKNTEAAGLSEAKKAAEAQKATTSDYYGEAQRLAAQTRNETRGQTGRTFANLGTIDSRGEGSYQQGMENIDTEFNRETQKRLNEKAAKLSDIDSTYYKAEVASNNAIRAKEAEKTKLVRQIKLAQQQNNLDLADQLTAAWQAADDSIAEIENNLIQLKYASEQETEKTQRELDQLKGLSESFLTSGKPSTMNDMMFVKDNPDFAKNIASMGLDGGVNTSKQKALGIAQELQKLNTSGITGPIRMAVSPESRRAESLLAQLSAELQLEEAKRLKGQGSLTDAERAILRDAVASFSIDPKNTGRSRLYDTQFRKVLDDMVNKLASETGATTPSNPQIVSLKAAGFTDAEIAEYLGGQ